MLPLPIKIMSTKNKTKSLVKNSSERNLTKIFANLSETSNVLNKNLTRVAALKNNRKIKHQINLTTPENSSYSSNKYIDNENGNVNSTCQNYIFSMKSNKQICCKTAIKCQHKRATKLPSSPASSASSAASLVSSHSWILCLWLWLAISSMTFVHCIPSPSSSMQQLQKRGKFLKFVEILSF